MVVFVDLEEDEDGLHNTLSDNTSQLERLRLHDGSQILPSKPKEMETQMTSRSGFSAAVSCYPIAFSLASHLDLNDLHSLSLTCRQIHNNLVQFCHQLVAHSLRCSHASQPLLSDIITRYNGSVAIGDTLGNAITGGYAGTPTIPNALPTLLAALSSTPSDHTGNTGRLLQSSKIGECARDLVADCRKCATIVCRNCAAKPPSDRCLPDRLRRLCRACLDAPLAAHLRPFKRYEPGNECPPVSSASSAKSVRSMSSSSVPTLSEPEAPALNESFTSAAFQRGPCTCTKRGVYLCSACGQNLRAADTTYKRVWTWRSRYSTHIGGGLGTGLGEGDQGQKCGRGEECLESGSGGVCWVEIDCSEKRNERDSSRPEASDSSSSWRVDMGGHHRANGHSTAGARGRDSDMPGYLQQEIEGIGGVVKKKVKKRVKVGATVWEYDDERESGRYLERESSGIERSWCGWCSRVVPGEADRAELAQAAQLIQAHSK